MWLRTMARCAALVVYAGVKIWADSISLPTLRLNLRNNPVRQVVYAGMNYGQIFFAVINERRRPPLEAFEVRAAEAPADAAVIAQYRDLMTRCWDDDAAQRPLSSDVLSELSAIHKLVKKRGLEGRLS